MESLILTCGSDIANERCIQGEAQCLMKGPCLLTLMYHLYRVYRIKCRADPIPTYGYSHRITPSTWNISITQEVSLMLLPRGSQCSEISHQRFVLLVCGPERNQTIGSLTSGFFSLKVKFLRFAHCTV